MNANGEFSLRAESGGGDVTIDNDIYEIESPNYPESYPSNKECIWRISIPSDTFGSVEFNRFDLESNPDCLNDFVEISFGDDSQPTRYYGK